MEEPYMRGLRLKHCKYEFYNHSRRDKKIFGNTNKHKYIQSKDLYLHPNTKHRGYILIQERKDSEDEAIIADFLLNKTCIREIRRALLHIRSKN